MAGHTLSNKHRLYIFFGLVRIVAGIAGDAAILKTLARLKQLHLPAVHIRVSFSRAKMREIKIRQGIAGSKSEQCSLHIQVIARMAGGTQIKLLLPR